MAEYARYLEAARDVAREAGDILERDYHRRGAVSFKGEIDLVTETDTASQALIHDRMAALFPGHDFLAEEGLRNITGAEFRWIIDPLDGTTNFAHRFPWFCVSIGLEHRGVLVAGVVFNPMNGELFSAEAGGGAFLNGDPIRVSSVGDIGRSLVATGFPYDIRESRTNMDAHDRFLLAAQAVRRCGSAAIDLCYVACGRFEGFWELKLNPWDTAAGAVVLAEAGGRLTDFHGRPADIYVPELCASNGLIHQAMLGLLREK
ncbi:MAG: inositol monophosphatase family protein [Candidatus Aminicenantes bacterium]|nr:inositol monophosphatase family protein [Candidatus Aminicenantes bacterium]